MKSFPLAYSVVALASVAIFASYVWPTAYILVPKESMVLRVNRFTGVEEWSSPQGWFREGGSMPVGSAKNVSGSLLVKGMSLEPGSSVGELVLQNSADQPFKAVHLEMSLVDAEGVVVGTATHDVEKIEKGDKVRVTIFTQTTTGTATTIRLDRAYSDWAPGATVASL